jgi:hypothetical protein
MTNNNSQEELIDIEHYSNTKQKPPAGKRYQVKVDDQTIVFNKEKVTGLEILEAACRTPAECYTLYQKLKDCDFEKVSLTEVVDLTKPGIERFVTKPPEVFHYDLDDEPETTELKEMTPNQILKAGGIEPKTHYLVQVNADGSQTSYRDKGEQPIKMKCPRVKYISVLNGPTPVS